MQASKHHKRVQITVLADSEDVDGYMEIIIGMLAMSNILVTQVESCQFKIEDGVTGVHMDMLCRRPPLGSLGLDDIPMCDNGAKQETNDK